MIMPRGWPRTIPADSVCSPRCLCRISKRVSSKGDGNMPILVERFVGMARSQQYDSKFPEGYPAAASKFYYDTAQVANPAEMSALTKVIPLSQIVFGTDYPFRTAAEHVKVLKECGVFSVKDLQLIDQNALKFLPKFKV